MRALTPLAALALASACAGEQSALAPDGPEARLLSQLFWVMTAGAAAILVLVVALAGVAIRGPSRWRRILARERTVFAGGVIFPVVVLSVLLVSGFTILGAGALQSRDDEALRITVIGEQWWWRVIYEHADGETTESANEIRIPVGRTVRIHLESADVIHSFWAPSYAGKVDMIPGRTNTLHLKADTPGVARGQCAEFCGGPHWTMAFYIVAMEQGAFDAWMTRERGDAAPPADPDGETLFVVSGCGACHTVRGTPADGRIGPDLTHVASRQSLGAGLLPNDQESFDRWLRDHSTLKPENRMPRFDIFEDDDARSLARYLAGLK